jgi:alkaline phosphatase
LTYHAFLNFYFQTYNVDYQVSDSGSAATALFSGIKTKGGTLGFDSSIDRNDPMSALSATKVSTVLDWAQEAGKEGLND